MTDAIVREFRLPMALMALVVGLPHSRGVRSDADIAQQPMPARIRSAWQRQLFGAALSLSLADSVCTRDFRADWRVFFNFRADWRVYLFNDCALFLFSWPMRTVRTATIILGGIAAVPFPIAAVADTVFPSPELSQQILFWLSAAYQSDVADAGADRSRQAGVLLC